MIKQAYCYGGLSAGHLVDKGHIVAYSRNWHDALCQEHVLEPLFVAAARLELQGRSRDTLALRFLWEINLNEKANLTDNDANDWIDRAISQGKGIVLWEHKQSKLDEILARQYSFHVLADQESQGYVVIFPDLPGCMTQIDNLSQLVEYAEEARVLWLMTAYQDGQSIPLPYYEA